MSKIPAAAVLIGLAGLPACGLLQNAPGLVQASRTQPCAKISWQDPGSAPVTDARPTRLAYGSLAQPQASSAIEIAELDQPLRSQGSIELSAEVHRQYEKARVQEIEHWVQAHLAVEVRSCPS